MAADIRQHLGLETKLIAGSRGIFDVVVDGKTVFSKHEEGNRFPDHDDIINRLKRVESK